MTPELKAKVAGEIQKQSKTAGSDVKLANKLKVSNATISNTQHVHNWHKVSDIMWRKLAAALGLRTDDWQIVPIAPYREITGLLLDCKEYGNMKGYVLNAGASKTVTVNAFRGMHKHVALLSCEEHWGKKEFLSKLLRAMGGDPDGLKLTELLDEIEGVASSQINPLIILDEFDKLKDSMWYFAISLYNRLHGKCGIFCCATPHLAKRLELGLRKQKMGYEELASRFGRRLINGVRPDSTDVISICKANGVQDTDTINRIVRDSMVKEVPDLRRVERLVHAARLAAQKAEVMAEQKGGAE